MPKPQLLVISHMHPFPGSSGQQRRVRYKLDAFRKRFHVTFLTFAVQDQESKVKEALLEYCDEAIVLPARYSKSAIHKMWYRIKSIPFRVYTGLKFSNYQIGKVELPPARIAEILDLKSFDCVVYEYWHASDSVPVLQSKNIPCVLDMHDILWKSYERQLNAKQRLPGIWKQWALKQYQKYEHAAWKQFDALIAINDGEHKHVKALYPEKTIFYAPMGIDTKQWKYSWEPSFPHRIAYYGGLGNPYNQQSALRCYYHIMPVIWDRYPETEFWIIGSNPPDSIQALPDKDKRIHVPGFVENIQELLETITAVLCPFNGQFGFRSRLIEVMSLGVPVAATHDAVYGMGMIEGEGLLLDNNDMALAEYSVKLIEKPEWAKDQSRLARKQVEDMFSFEGTYGKLSHELYKFVSDYKLMGKA